ncbi:MAG: ABC transporter ATP-binding protein [Treponema sp.]|nr:MAG: ABC transporter ATP-binding protein [Treponema sp.]
MSDTAIRLEGVSKMYKLGVINNGTLFRDLQTWWALKRGKEDPHSKIGQDKYSGNDTEFWALKDLNLDIKQGDRVGIIGKNGAGKSTLLKVLSRITTPTEGRVKIKGKVSSLLEVGTGFHGELTGRENIYLNGAILGMKKKEIDRKLDEIIDFSGIEKHIDTPVKRYSSGMYVRLAFAVAAHLDSDILIADEVLAVGDAEFQKKAIGKMGSLSTEQGRTVLFVSHNMAAVKQLCNSGVLLEKGKIVSKGTINNVINAYSENKKKNYRAEIISVKDQNLKRGNGAIDFTDIFFDKDSYKVDEDINIRIAFKINKSFNGLYFSLMIKNKFSEKIAEFKACIEKGMMHQNEENTIYFNIPKNTLSPGSYPLYFWLADELSLYGPAVNYCVLDEFTPDLIIEDDNSVLGLNKDCVILSNCKFLLKK